MKNTQYILKYGLLAALSSSLFSCESDEGEVEYAEGNSYAVIRESEISLFDIAEDLTFDVFVEPGATLAALEVFEGDEKLADATVGEGTIAENTAVFSTASLVPFEFEDDAETGTLDLTAYSTGTNDDQGVTDFSIDVVSPISFTNEVSSVVYGETDLEDTDAIISYETFTFGATIDSVTLFWKNGEDGTYVEDTVVELATDTGEIDLRNLDYINEYGLGVDDELFYQIEIASGDLTQTIETSVVLEAE